MRLLSLLVIFLLVTYTFASASHGQAEDAYYIESLLLLKKAHDLQLISTEEYESRKADVLDRITGVTEQAHSDEPGYSDQVKYLLNQLVKGMPRSYSTILPTGENYWLTSTYLEAGAVDPSGNQVELDSEIAIQERTLSTYGLNLYDGATWQIALALAGLADVAEIYERNILYTSSTGSDSGIGGLINIRADASNYLYGPNSISGTSLATVNVPGNTTRIVSVNGNPTGATSKTQPGAFFYRMIGPKYPMSDPLVGDYANSWKYPYPNNDTSTPWNQPGIIHWNDWKPITGENVWGVITGPLQTMWIAANGTQKMQKFLTYKDAPSAVQLALTILPALKALQSPLGSLYHCPKGTNMFPADPQEETNVSNENNYSAYAALVMLQQILTRYSAGTSDAVLVNALNDVKGLVTGLENWFSKYLLADPYKGFRVFYQGGHVKGSTFQACPINQTGGFAVDCQTWAIAALGQAKIDGWYGMGTAYQLWQATKKFAGYYQNGNLAGVGYTSPDNDKDQTIWSAEWTWGAITAVERLSYEYKKIGRNDYANDLADDADDMTKQITKPVKRCDDDLWCGGGLRQEDGSYLYANARFFIPWGWYANPIGATCSTAWAEMNANDFNPFVLGGGFTSPLA